MDLGVLIPHRMLFPLFEAGSLLCPWPQLLPIPDAKSFLPHLLQGEIAAWVLFIWLVLMVDSTRPFRFQMRIVVSLEAVMMNFPERRGEGDMN